MAEKTQKTNIYTALLAFQKNKPEIPMNGDNKFKGYKYAKLSDICAAIDPVLSECGIIYSFTEHATPQPFANEGEIIIPVTHFNLKLIHVESDTSIESIIPLPDSKNIQDHGANMTYLKRYGICNILNLNGDEDTDGGATNKPTARNQNKNQTVQEKNKPAVKKELTELSPEQINAIKEKFASGKKPLGIIQALLRVYEMPESVAEQIHLLHKNMNSETL